MYLQGQHFEIHTDHRPLVHIFSGKTDLSNKMTRYALFLSDYDFTIKYVPGSENIIADALSRREYDQEIKETGDQFTEELGLPPIKPDSDTQVNVVTRAQLNKQLAEDARCPIIPNTVSIDNNVNKNTKINSTLTTCLSHTDCHT